MKLVCTKCINENYYLLTNNSHCIHINSFVQKIPFCSYQSNYLEKYIIKDNTTSDNTSLNMENSNFGNGTNNTNNTNITKYEYQLKSYCSECRNGYVKNNNSCQPINITNCSLSNIISFYRNSYTEEEEYNYEAKWRHLLNCERL